MSESGQTSKNVQVRVNGTLLKQYRKPTNDLYDYDIDWLLNDAPALLGESGVSYSGEGNGGATIADTGPHHEKAIAAIGAVQRARRLTAVWNATPPGDRSILSVRYVQRRRWPPHFEALFGEFTGVVIFITRNDGSYRDLKNAVSNASKHTKMIMKARRDAEEITRDAHHAWRDARHELDLDAACQPWSRSAI
jgi:hypothetical protein